MSLQLLAIAAKDADPQVTEGELFQWIPVAALAVSFVAVVVGPIIQLVIATRQMKTSREIAQLAFTASVLSSNRQAWINDLRGALAGYVAKCWSIWMGRMGARGTGDREDVEGSELRIAEAIRLESQIELMLNPNEEDHKALAAAMRDARDALTDESLESGVEFEGVCRRVLTLARPVLKREWVRVKQGE